MDNRPIGVFDSGLGGLTCVRELERRMPHESVIYFGDTGRVPYGGRSREIITKYARQDVAFLRTHDLKAIVIACGTVSSTAIEELKAEQDIPIFGVVEPTALKAVESTKNGKIGLIATRATIATGAYEKIMLERDPDLEVHAAACPLFVPLVENGRTEPGDVVIETVVKDYLTPLKEAGIDTLVLGCTHYPLIREVIQNFMGPEVTLVDSGAEVAHQVERYLTEQDRLSGLKERGHCQWFVSDSQQGFRDLACCFLGRPVVERVGRVDIERY